MKRGDNSQFSWLSTALISAGVSAVVSITLLAGVGSVTSNIPQNQLAAIGQSVATSSDEGLSSDSSVIKVAAEAGESVVSIAITKDVPVIERYLREGPFGFRQLESRISGTETRIIGEGSGFFVSENGLIVTNQHVVSDEEASYTAITKNGDKYKLELIDRDPALDIAILKTKEAGDFNPLTFGDSSNLQLGQTVIAIGNALGELRNSVSVGVVSGLSRSIVAGSAETGLEQLEQVIQTDAAINFGNSGGPLLNLSGEVIGVNVAIARGSQNVSFALPANAVEQAVNSVREYGEILRPFLGVRYVTITESIARQRDLSVEQGALILPGPVGQFAVTPGSPADEAGLQAGDIIVSVDGREVTPDRSLAQIIQEHTVGDTVSIVFIRNKKRLEVRTTLKSVPEEAAE